MHHSPLASSYQQDHRDYWMPSSASSSQLDLNLGMGIGMGLSLNPHQFLEIAAAAEGHASGGGIVAGAAGVDGVGVVGGGVRGSSSSLSIASQGSNQSNGSGNGSLASVQSLVNFNGGVVSANDPMDVENLQHHHHYQQQQHVGLPVTQGVGSPTLIQHGIEHTRRHGSLHALSAACEMDTAIMNSTMPAVNELNRSSTTANNNVPGYSNFPASTSAVSTPGLGKKRSLEEIGPIGDKSNNGLSLPKCATPGKPVGGVDDKLPQLSKLKGKLLPITMHQRYRLPDPPLPQFINKTHNNQDAPPETKWPGPLSVPSESKLRLQPISCLSFEGNGNGGASVPMSPASVTKLGLIKDDVAGVFDVVDLPDDDEDDSHYVLVKEEKSPKDSTNSVNVAKPAESATLDTSKKLELASKSIEHLPLTTNTKTSKGAKSPTESRKRGSPDTVATESKRKVTDIGENLSLRSSLERSSSYYNYPPYVSSYHQSAYYGPGHSPYSQYHPHHHPYHTPAGYYPGYSAAGGYPYPPHFSDPMMGHHPAEYMHDYPMSLSSSSLVGQPLQATSTSSSMPSMPSAAAVASTSAPVVAAPSSGTAISAPPSSAPATIAPTATSSATGNRTPPSGSSSRYFNTTAASNTGPTPSSTIPPSAMSSTMPTTSSNNIYPSSSSMYPPYPSAYGHHYPDPYHPHAMHPSRASLMGLGSMGAIPPMPLMPMGYPPYPPHPMTGYPIPPYYPPPPPPHPMSHPMPHHHAGHSGSRLRSDTCLGLGVVNGGSGAVVRVGGLVGHGGRRWKVEMEKSSVGVSGGGVNLVNTVGPGVGGVVGVSEPAVTAPATTTATPAPVSGGSVVTGEATEEKV
ncbi:hypothetical protein HDU76_013569 [Blyttiomyces sp. JEL0837]|nr:hypothetical protein HDU76_013569 [Blyttiomyces sp. JEL0837]